MGCASQGEKAAIIKRSQEKGFQLKHLLKAMNLSRSTYYYELSKTDTISQRNKPILEEIKRIFDLNKGRYGVRRIHRELLNQGLIINHKRVQRLMHDMKLLGKRPKEKYHSYKGQVRRIADNLINRDFSASAPLQKLYYTNELKQRGIIQSMSRKGNCYDNCIMETFFGRMKNEMFYEYEKDYLSFADFKNAAEEYINYYNNERIQAKTKWMPPVKYREASMCPEFWVHIMGIQVSYFWIRIICLWLHYIGKNILIIYVRNITVFIKFKCLM